MIDNICPWCGEPEKFEHPTQRCSRCRRRYDGARGEPTTATIAECAKCLDARRQNELYAGKIADLERDLLVMRGVCHQEVINERLKQRMRWSSNRDDKLVNHELAYAAIATLKSYIHQDGWNLWPFGDFKEFIQDKSRRRRLEIAAALCLAELDRLDRETEQSRAEYEYQMALFSPTPGSKRRELPQR